MASTTATGRYYEALNETSDAFIDMIRAANDRGHRFTTALIEQAQENQRDAVENTRKWAESPFDIIGLMSMWAESATKAQGRALDATRQLFSEMSDAQKETREVIQKVISTNRTVGEASVEVARNAFSKATTAVQSATETNGIKTAVAKADSAKNDAKAS